MKVLKYSCLFIAVIFLFSGCNPSGGKKENRAVFRYNESAGITTLDPAFAKDQAHIWVCNQLYNGLVQFDDSLYIKPCIAKRWTISDDGLTYTFVLRRDVVFHNDALFPQGKGRKVVATAVKGTLPVHCDGETVCFEGKELTIELLPAQIDFITQKPQ